MIDEEHLREGLQRLLRDTEAAIRERISDEPSIESHLRERHTAAVQAGRTAGSASGYNSFADEAITQSAVHWLLGCVFVRFLEDNGWLDERNRMVGWLAGPGERLAIAKGERTRFLRPDPRLTDRDYLLYVFREVAKLPGMAGLFDARHNPLFQLGPTGQGVAKIVDFFQKVDPDTGALVHDFTDPEHGTRFLGDLYQNLSESARKRYALCQTPGFVIDFILDRTLTPAIDTFGLDKVRLIDPSCGSGHFLLAAFTRLFRLWQEREPATNPPALAQRALDAVHGVDLNPFAAEISRFRLLIAALLASGVTMLRNALDFRISVAAGDSLLHGRTLGRERAVQRHLGHDPSECYFEAEDPARLQELLVDRYSVVVGNPPYISVQDPTLREVYRERYGSCQGKYQLSAPFFERFFNLAQRSENGGFVGMLTSNAFMRRSFGKCIVEQFVPSFDLTYIVDTSKAHIPNHGTPTVIIIGRNRLPTTRTIRVVRGIRAEAQRPDDPATAPVWQAIAKQIDEAGSESQWVSVADVDRSTFEHHPWPMGGGGAAELKQRLDDVGAKLSTIVRSIGITSFTLLDDVFLLPASAARRREIPDRLVRPMVCGDALKDWVDYTWGDVAIFPYDDDFRPITETDANNSLAAIWPARTSLANGVLFGQKVKAQAGLKWYEFGRLTAWKLMTPLSITFSNVVTHNHFVLDRGGKVFNSHAPVIKLSPTAVEKDYLEILGLLNSSTACFWLKQVCHNKGGGGIGGGLATESWEQFYDLNATPINAFPVPTERPYELTRLLQAESEAFASQQPERILAKLTPSALVLRGAREGAQASLFRMISLQEELDWNIYSIYGLLDEDLSISLDEVPPLRLGERPFEILMARQMAKGELKTAWFDRHGSKAITELPTFWPGTYRQIVEKRLEVIDANRDIALIERPEFKRRWNLPSWEEMERIALKNWLLDRMEETDVWREKAIVSCAQLRDLLARDSNWLTAAEIFNGSPIENLDNVITKLAVAESVPFLPALRYSESGRRKYIDWERVWDLQRREDAGEKVELAVPPKYRANDFPKSDYWRLRGGVDMPNERFILYAGLERDADRSPVLGWAGWNHLERAQALAGYYQRMRTEEGWDPERLKPVLAGLLDLKPWLVQWHNKLDPETGVKLGEYFVQFAESQCQELGFSPEEVRAWQPAATTSSGTRTRRATARRPQ